MDFKNKYLRQPKGLKLFSSLFLSSMLTCLVACSSTHPGKFDGYKKANADPYKATINSLVCTDALGRSFGEKDVTSSDRYLGMFYFIWHGEHINNEIYDVEYLKKNNPAALWANKNSPDYDPTLSREGDFHYFDEPLYGYYCSDDPWVITRHIELLTMSGVDYISFDLTNFGLYEDNVKAVLDKLLEFQAKGWKVPLVTSILNGTAVEANHATRIKKFYDTFYTDSTYDSLWLRDEINHKPLVTISIDDYLEALPQYVRDNITFRNAIWPYDESESIYDDNSWMDWETPNRVYENEYLGNHMVISVAQHPNWAFGLSVNPNTKEEHYNTARGRGYNYETKQNVASDVNKGTNMQYQWDYLMSKRESSSIRDAFVTGWNEWIAYKLQAQTLSPYRFPDNDNIVFCDTCDDEFSRDLEMTKEGYGDNFYLQNMLNSRNYKNTEEVKFFGSRSTVDLTSKGWENARTYLDFTGDAIERNFDRADHKDIYVNDTNRNDISKVLMTNDDSNLYIQIECDKDIVVDNVKDNNLNILLNVNNANLSSWEGYNFILNRGVLGQGSSKTSLEKVKTQDKFEFEKVKEVESYRKDNFMSIRIPLADLGIANADEFTIDFKVADNMSEPGNIMNYYVDGDSAPIGRLNYRYNSKIDK